MFYPFVWVMRMKNLKLLIWITQLGLSVVLPFIGFVFLALWLQNQFGWGQWTLWAGIALGFLCAVEGFRSSLKAMQLMAKEKEENHTVSFNEHD